MSLALHPLLPAARPLFDRYLAQTERPLSAYSFITHRLWRGHFSFYWVVYKGCLLLFAKYDRCVYMPLPPLGPCKQEIVSACFDWMDQNNPGREVSRIENIGESDRVFYRQCGLEVKSAYPEYIYRRDDLANLKGDRYKAQRWGRNALKRSFPTIRAYAASDRNAAERLYQKWSKGRASLYADPVYIRMLSDSESVHRLILREWDLLGMTGVVVEVSGQVVGYSFGFSQNPDTFCIAVEVADLERKGVAPYLFSSFCRILNGYRWINTMDDSGLPNLQRVKASYRPVKLAACYMARRVRGASSMRSEMPQRESGVLLP